MAFKKATKRAAKLRIAIAGPSGSGKTFTSLAIATAMGKKIAVADSEHESASKYADLFDFDTEGLTNYHPRAYIDAIREAEAGGYDAIVLDSLSHAWAGSGGVLDIAGGNFNNWRNATPVHNALIEKILGSTIHVIATMRTKTEWVVEANENGKMAPRKVGTAPVQRADSEYEFDVFGMLDASNTLRIEKTRCPAINGRVFHQPGAEFAQILMNWLSTGVADPVFDAALAGGMDVVNNRPWAEVGEALKAHVASVPESIRDEVRARLVTAYKTREALERSAEKVA